MDSRLLDMYFRTDDRTVFLSVETSREWSMERYAKCDEGLKEWIGFKSL
jgi:hypothetical protein